MKVSFIKELKYFICDAFIQFLSAIVILMYFNMNLNMYSIEIKTSFLSIASTVSMYLMTVTILSFLIGFVYSYINSRDTLDYNISLIMKIFILITMSLCYLLDNEYKSIQFILLSVCYCYFLYFITQLTNRYLNEYNSVYLNRIEHLTDLSCLLVIPLNFWQDNNKGQRTITLGKARHYNGKYNHCIIALDWNFHHWASTGFIKVFNSDGLFIKNELISYENIEMYNIHFNKLLKQYTKEEFDLLKMYIL